MSVKNGTGWVVLYEDSEEGSGREVLAAFADGAFVEADEEATGYLSEQKAKDDIEESELDDKRKGLEGVKYRIQKVTWEAK